MHMELPSSQRAWTWQGAGEPTTLQLAEVPVRKPGPGEVLIANEYIGLNPVDWKLIGKDDTGWLPGHVPGVDGCGRLIACGEGVDLEPGTRLAYHQAFALTGSFAEYVTLRVEATFIVPRGLPAEQGAAFPCPVLTAWQAIDKLPAQEDCDVLISGAGSGVGQLMAQLALARGWRVWATASRQRHEALLALGVSGVFDYRHENWRKDLARALGPRRLWAICDTVNGEHAASLASLIGYNGHLVCVQDRMEENPVAAFTTSVSLHEVALGSIHGNGRNRDWRQLGKAAQRLFADVASGALRMPSLNVASFARLPEALLALKQQERPGKWVVRVGNDARD